MKKILFTIAVVLFNYLSFATNYSNTFPVSFSIGSTANYCVGASASGLTATFTKGGCGSTGFGAYIISYQWYYNTTNVTTTSGATTVGSSATVNTTDGDGPVTIPAPTPNTDIAGDYYYFVVLTWTGYASGDCISSISRTLTSSTTKITVDTLPTPTFTATPSSNSCVGTNVTYTTQSGGGINNYQWVPPGVLGTDYSIISGGLGTGSSTVTLHYLTTGIKTVSINYSNSNGCTAASPTISTTTVDTLPDLITGPITLCKSSTATLSNVTSGGTWSSESPTIATINSSSGFVTGINAGSSLISYTLVNACGTHAATVNITINTLPDISNWGLPTGNTVCMDSSSLITIHSNSLLSGSYNIIYSLSAPNFLANNDTILTMGSGVTGTFNTTKLVNSGTTTITIDSIKTLLGCAVSLLTNKNVDITVNQPPVPIFGRPAVCISDITLLYESVLGGVWSSSSPTKASVIPGNTSDTGIVTGVATGTTTISYSKTGCPVATLVVTVNATTPTAITGMDSVCAGSNTTLSESISGGVWSSDFSALAIVNNTGIVTGKLQGVDTIRYDNGCGTAAELILKVHDTTNVTTTRDTTLCFGDIISFQFTGTHNTSGATFSWSRTITDNIGVSLDNGNDSIAQFTANNIPGTVDVMNTFTVVPVSAYGCIGTQNVFTVKVHPLPTINNIPNTSYCNGTSHAISFTGTSTPLLTTYNWSNSDTSIGRTGALSGIGSFTVIANNGTYFDSTFTITVTPKINGCPDGTPISFTDTVHPTPLVSHTNYQSICNLDSTNLIHFSGLSDISITYYNWINNNTTIGLVSSGSGDISPFQTNNVSISNNTALITVTPLIGNCAGSNDTFTINVKPTPRVAGLANDTFCNSLFISGTTFSTPAGLSSISWHHTNTNLFSAGDLSVNSGSTYTISSFYSTNNGDTIETDSLNVQSILNGCTFDTNYVYVVNPTPKVNSMPNFVFNNSQYVDSNVVMFTGPTPNTSYYWTNNNTSIGLLASGNRNSLDSFTAVNTGNDSVFATIDVTPKIGSCAGHDSTFTITILPTSTITFTKGSDTVCNGIAYPTVTINCLVAGTTYIWLNTDSTNGLSTTGSGTISSGIGALTFNPCVNTGTSFITTTITVIPYSASGQGVPSSFNVVITPTPDISPIPSQIKPNGGISDSIKFIPTTTGCSYTYSWINSNTTLGLPISSHVNSDTNYIDTFTTINTNTYVDSTVITVTPFIGICTGNQQSLKIYVNPTPRMAITGVISPVCNGDSITNASDTIKCTSLTYGTTFTWVNIDSANSIGIASTGTATVIDSVSSYIPTFIATNNSDTFRIDTIVVTPWSHGVKGIDTSFIIMVNPTPKVTPVTPKTINYCDSIMSSIITFTGATKCAITYCWYNIDSSKLNVGSDSSGINSLASFKAINLTNNPIIDTFIVLPMVGTCTGVKDTFNIKVFPDPKLNNHPTKAICNDMNLFDTVSSPTQGPVSYAWLRILNTHITTDTTHGTDSIINELVALHNNDISDIQVTYIFTVTETVNGCKNRVPQYVIDTVYPTPHLSSSLSDTICNNTQFPYTLTDSVVGCKFWWKRNDVAGITTPGINSWVNDSSRNETLHNDTNLSRIVVYDDSVLYKTCGYHYSNFVVVRPYARLIDTLKSICSEATLSFPLNNYSSVIEATNHKWNVIQDSLSLWNVDVLPNNGINNISTYVKSNYQHTPYVLTFIDTMSIFLDSAGGIRNTCTSFDSVKITIKPRPHKPLTVLPLADKIIFKGMLHQFYTDSFPHSDTVGLKYVWMASNNNARIDTQSTSLPYHQNALISFIEGGSVKILDSAYFVNYGECGVVDTTPLTVDIPSTQIDHPVIKLFKDSSTMICFDNTDSTYLWGYDNISTFKSSFLKDKRGGVLQVNQDLVFDKNLIDERGDSIRLKDTAYKLFWVQTTRYLDGKLLTQKTYYEHVQVVHKGPIIHNVLSNTEIALNLYPNPTNNNLVLELIDTGSTKIEYQIFDIWGKTVRLFNTDFNIINIPVGDLPSGSYYVLCNRNGVKIASSKFIKL